MVHWRADIVNSVESNRTAERTRQNPV